MISEARHWTSIPHCATCSDCRSLTLYSALVSSVFSCLRTGCLVTGVQACRANRSELSSEFWKRVLNIKNQWNNACCLVLISSQLYPNPAFFSGRITCLFKLLPAENGFVCCQVHLWNNLLTADLSVSRILVLKQKVMEYLNNLKPLLTY